MSNASDFIIENGVLKSMSAPVGMWSCRRA